MYNSTICIFRFIIMSKKKFFFCKLEKKKKKLNKFGVLRLLHFHKRILPSSCGWILLSKTLEGYVWEKDWYIDKTSGNKESVLLFLHQISVFLSLSLIIGVLWKRCVWAGNEGGLSKWKHRKVLEIY